jgi:hypothetical protein
MTLLFEIEKTEKPASCAANFPKAQLKSMLSQIKKGVGKEHVFCSGTDGLDWICVNCDRCAIPNGNNRRVVRGLDCVGEYAVACGFITGTIPAQIVEHFGIGLQKCKQFAKK